LLNFARDDICASLTKELLSRLRNENPAAIANAIFDATGIRLREVPFTPKRVLAGLQAATQTSKAS
jgi:hypothetical protein